jgi:PhoH-like ATPase
MKKISRKAPKPTDFYTGVFVIEKFQHLNELFKKKALPLDPYFTDTLPNEERRENLCLVLKSGKHQEMGIVKDGQVRHLPWLKEIHGITPRDMEQHFAMHLLLDEDIDLVTITGCAGSGKTLLALAYAMDQMKKGNVNKVVLARNFVPVGKEIGFLKGGMGEKIRPWMGAFYDNFEVIGVPPYIVDDLTSFEGANETSKRYGRIELSPTTFIQGRSISNAIIIVDEVQNMPPVVVKQILTRPAENSKLILLGDPNQVFEKGVTEKNNGLVAAVKAGEDYPFIGHIHLLKSERSRLAAWANKEM